MVFSKFERAGRRAVKPSEGQRKLSDADLTKTSFEKQLEQTYAATVGEEVARDLVQTAKEKVTSDRSFSDPPIPLERLRDEGVTPTDWDWWWSMQPLERAAMIAVDEMTKMSALVNFRSEGMSAEDAVAKTRRLLPLFGNPWHHGDYQSPDDRPLPRELKNRVTNSALALASSMSDSYTSMNALIRQWIRSGRL